MFIKKRFLFLVLIASFLLGYFIPTTVHYYKNYLRGKPAAPPSPKTVEKKEEPQVKVDRFFQVLNLNELVQFDQLYEQRQKQLRDIIGSGSQDQTLVIPKGLFAQVELIQSKIGFLNKLETYSEGQSAIRQSFINAYQLLKETFEKEIEFLKNYPEQGQNISFITQNIFEISGQDQRSGFQYLDCLATYRKLLAEAIREDQAPEKNQSRVRGLVTLNALIEKYKASLHIPKDSL